MALSRIKNVVRLACHFVHDTRGSTAIEYGLICGLIFLAIVAAIQTTASTLMTNFWNPTAAAFNH